MKKDIKDLREEYALATLDLSDVDPNPMVQFSKWFENAVDSNLPEPNAMTLATVGNSGFPSARIVLLKGFDEKGFVFFTNYKSQKGTEISDNPHVALVFSWLELQRQIRIEGVASMISQKDSEEYFKTRPRGSKIGALASPQSRPIERKDLEHSFQMIENQFLQSDDIPMPEYWGGYLVKPVRIEFWQGRRSRLHDRINYSLVEGNWKLERLAP
jgi:pyridoxamine 5'-phosphate oxidase